MYLLINTCTRGQANFGWRQNTCTQGQTDSGWGKIHVRKGKLTVVEAEN